jgi:hypothetical protein
MRRLSGNQDAVSMVHVVSAKALPDYRLEVTFNDGTNGIFHVEPERRGGVFLKLLDAQVFNAVTINADFGCVEWPGGVDLAPEAMHRALTGSQSEIKLGSAAVLRQDAGGR